LAIPLIAAAFALHGCATHSHAALFDVGFGASAELQALSTRAAAGDKWAQYELGLLFEQGQGVPANRGRAMQLYALAGRDDPGKMTIYVPSSKSGGKSSLQTFDSGRRAKGLAVARDRLKQMQEAER
jgi:hypothetical protein